uniref:Activin types I and II receptor domain-containing protein n=2 Tax=Bactrocera latifrons TaxID=174628 RepID=A0A0K8VVL6_BACLA
MSELRRRSHQIQLTLASLVLASTPSAQQRKKPPILWSLSLITVSLVMLILLPMRPTDATPIEIVFNTTRNSPIVDTSANKWMSPYGNVNNGSVRKGTVRQQENTLVATVPSSATISTTAGRMDMANNISKHDDTLPMALVPQQTTLSTPLLHQLSGHKSNSNKRERPLKCHCDICKDTNFICETDGYCFTSVVKDEDKIIFSYRHMYKRK